MMNNVIQKEHAAPLRLAAETAIEFLSRVGSERIAPSADAATLRRRLGGPLPTPGEPGESVIRALATNVRDGLLGSQSGAFFAWVVGGALPSAVAADWLTSAWDQNAAIFATSPAAAIVEEIAGQWLKNLLRLPDEASFAFVTGCQMAHVTCLAAARHAILQRCGWDVEERGLFDAPRVRVISSVHRHGSIDRALRLLGFGNATLQLLRPGDDETMQAQALERALQESSDPAIVLLQAGDINTGAFDSFSALIPIAHRYSAWVHVDGAVGLWAATSPKFSHLTEGIEHADSWATDGHKWLNVPHDCGYAFVADAQSHRASMSVRAPYFSEAAHARDEIDWNPDWSRRARGFATYAALRELGAQGIAQIVERTSTAARSIVDELGSLPNVEVLWRPILNQGLVRFLDPNALATEADHDRYTERAIDEIVAGGEAYFGPTTWRGRRAMRVSAVNWRTDQECAKRAATAVRDTLQRLEDNHGVMA